MRNKLLWPVLAGFFVMGFGDIIGPVLFQVKRECATHADVISYLLPIFAYVWFVLISIPTGILCGRLGRKHTVLISLALSALAMFLPLAASATRWWIYLVAFALIGIGNTIIQAALPALLSNVVASDKLTSRITLGQFIKSICAVTTPLVVGLAATCLGNWKLVFPLYGLVTILTAVWLAFSRIADERKASASAQASRTVTSFASCLKVLKHPYVLAMTVGILFAVGADVGFAVAIPEYLQHVFRVDANRAGMGPTIFFAAKMFASFVGAILFARVSPAKCFPWFMGIGLLLTLFLPFAGSAILFLTVVFVVSFVTANGFGMCMGLALDKLPDKANEITALMTMAIVGGGVVSALVGIVLRTFGAGGVVGVLALCIAYLFCLGLFANRKG